MRCEVTVLFFFFFCLCMSSCPSTVCWKDHPSSTELLFPFAQNQSSIFLWVCSPFPLICVSIPLPIPKSLLLSFIIKLEPGKLISLTLVFFFRIVFNSCNHGGCRVNLRCHREHLPQISPCSPFPTKLHTDTPGLSLTDPHDKSRFLTWLLWSPSAFCSSNHVSVKKIEG